MKVSGCLTLALLVGFCATSVRAEEYVFALKNLEGKYTTKGQKARKVLNFHAGMDFDEIESVEIHLTGTLKKGALRIYNNAKNKESVWKKGYNPTILVRGEEAGSDDVVVGHLRRSRNKFEAVIPLSHFGDEGSEMWQCLLDGKLDLELGLSIPKYKGKGVVWQSRLASLKASDVELVVNGVAAAPVPEPGTIGMGLLGMTLLGLRRRRAA